MTRNALALAAGLIVAVTAAPALAQNAGQIARVQQGRSCAGCNLFQADLSGLEAGGLNLSRSRLRQADLSLSVMNRTNFSGADLRDVEAYGAVFGGANFSGADLTNASFVGTHLVGASFSGANLSGADFSGAEMEGARGLTQARLNRACGDAATRLPRGLSIPAC